MTQQARHVPHSIFSRVLWRIGGAILLAIVLHPAPAAFAQFITGSVSGTVRDPSGAVVPKADVTLINEATNNTRTVLSDSAGYFTFAGVDTGTYSITVSATGFEPWKVIDVEMNAGEVRTVPDIVLKVGAATQTVSVTASSAQIVPIDTGTHAYAITSKDLQKLSLEGRDVSEVLKLLPGASVAAVTSPSSGGTSLDFSTVANVGGAVGNGIEVSGAPYRGGEGYLLDGVNIIDVGCNCYSIVTPNPDMVSEVQVLQSFGADEPNGPVVISVTSKSGGDKFHGEGYFYARNQALNSNTWLNNYNKSPKQTGEWYYPGGNIGGPILIPHTTFNKAGKLFFWAGYEYARQLLPTSTPFESYIPSAGMMAGNFTLSGNGNSALCPNGFVKGGTNWCGDPTGSLDASGNAVNPLALPVDPGAAAIMKLFPTPNANPATTPGGYNYVFPYSNPQNSYTWRGRVDYHINDNNKVFVSYQQGHTVFQTLAHIYYNPAYDIPYPGGGLDEPNTSRAMTVNYISVIRPTLTNEFVFGWGWANGPTAPSHLSAMYKDTLGYPYATIYNSASLVVPSVNSAGAQTFPDLSQPAFFDPAGVYPLKKQSPSFADNITKVWKTHTFKFGAFTELVGNDQGGYEYPNGQFSFGSAPETNKVTGSGVSPATLIGSTNPTANLVEGIADYFSQNSYENVQDLASRTTSFYVMDDWKFNRRLTLDIGMRWDHVGRWYDRQGVGQAVWYPQLYAQDVAENQGAKAMVVEYPGLRWRAIDSGIPNGGSPTRLAWSTPRLGFAYDLQGQGETVIRGGWGEYVWNDDVQSGALTTSENVTTYNSPGSQAITMAQVPLQTQAGNNQPAGSVTALAYNDIQDPLTYAWNLTVDRQLPLHSLLEVSYVGNSTHHELLGEEVGGASGVASGGFINQNKIPLGGLFKPDPVTGVPAPKDPENNATFDVEDYEPYSGCTAGGSCYGYGTNSISVGTHSGYANYNGLQVAWLKQQGHAYWDFNYTWSKALGIVETTYDAFNLRNNYGILDIDRPQVFNASYAYSFGDVYHGGEHLVSGVVNGWNASGTTTIEEGGNLESNGNLGLTIQEPNGTGNNTSGNYENLTTRTYFGTDADEILPLTTCNPRGGLQSHQLMNLSCFSAPVVGTQGDRVIHPYLRGPIYDDSDLSIYKTFHVHEAQNVQFRASAFDFMNHSLWGSSGGNLLDLYFSTTNGGQSFTPNSSVYSGDGVKLTGACGTGSSTWGCENQKAPFSGAGYARIVELSVKYNF